jgi:N-acetylneuraminate synthase
MDFPPDNCLVIAEVAQAHDGSLGAAHAYIDAAARAGAGAVKFQTHIAAAESSLAEPWRVKFSMQDATRYDYWRRMEFTEEQWAGLRIHAEERGMLFLSSPFSVEAAELLRRVGVRAWKIASGEVNNAPLFDFIADTGLPVLLSTGMSSIAEIDRAVEQVRARRLPLTVLQCTTAYPCPEEKIGLNLLPFFRERYRCEVGLSDHSGKIYPGLAAVTLGARVLEVHVTFSRECFGPDVPASLTIAELTQLVEGVRFIEKTLRNPVDKDEAAAGMEPLRGIFTKSVAARSDLRAGAVLSMENLTLKKPGTGIPAERLRDLVGRTLRRPVQAGDFLSEADFEEPVVSPAVA